MRYTGLEFNKDNFIRSSRARYRVRDYKDKLIIAGGLGIDI